MTCNIQDVKAKTIIANLHDAAFVMRCVFVVDQSFLIIICARVRAQSIYNSLGKKKHVVTSRNTKYRRFHVNKRPSSPFFNKKPYIIYMRT